MSVGSISGSAFESMRAKFESFRSGQGRLQKADLEEIKTAIGSQEGSQDPALENISELIEKFSEIDSDGDGISSEELSTAAENGTISAPSEPPGGQRAGGPPYGPPPGGMPPGPPPGPPPNGENGDSNAIQAQSGQFFGLNFDLFGTSGSDEDDSVASNETTGTDAESHLVEQLIEELNESSSSSGTADSEDSSDSDLSESQAKNLTRFLAEFIRKTYEQNALTAKSDSSSLLGEGLVA